MFPNMYADKEGDGGGEEGLSLLDRPLNPPLLLTLERPRRKGVKELIQSSLHAKA